MKLRPTFDVREAINKKIIFFSLIFLQNGDSRHRHRDDDARDWESVSCKLGHPDTCQL